MSAKSKVDKSMSSIDRNLDQNIQYLQNMADMLREQNQCLEMGGKYSNQCTIAIANKYTRMLPFMKNLVYPWRNYDWDYSMYVEKYYEPKKNFGASDSHSITAIIRDVNSIINLIDGLLVDPNPSGYKQSIGQPRPKIVTSAASDPSYVRNDLVPCASNTFDPVKVDKLQSQVSQLMGTIQTIQKQPQNQNTVIQLSVLKESLKVTIALLDQAGDSCSLLNQTKIDGLQQKAPYDDAFFRRYPLDGTNSSSFYSQIGYCPTNITNQSECDSKGYQWTPNPLAQVIPSSFGNIAAGTCMRGRYAYIDNKPGLTIGQIKNFKGLIPSLMNDMLDLSPDKIFAVASGEGVPGFSVQHCDEGFTVGNSPKTSKCQVRWVWVTILVNLVIITLAWFLYQRYK